MKDICILVDAKPDSKLNLIGTPFAYQNVSQRGHALAVWFIREIMMVEITCTLVLQGRLSIQQVV